MREGTDLTIICCGITVLQSIQAAKTLAEQDGLSVRVINMHTIKPLDRDAILKAAVETRRILTVGEHNVVGGLGDAVGCVIAESGKGCAFKKHGIYDEFSTIGYAEDLYAHYGLDANGIIDQIRAMMGLEFEEDENWETSKEGMTMSATPQEIMTAKLFFNAAFPVMQVLLDDDPKLKEKFRNVSGIAQFGARNGNELLACHLIFDHGTVSVVSGPAENPDISLTFSSVEK
jgi:hypothetical protein